MPRRTYGQKTRCGIYASGICIPRKRLHDASTLQKVSSVQTAMSQKTTHTVTSALRMQENHARNATRKYMTPLRKANTATLTVHHATLRLWARISTLSGVPANPKVYPIFIQNIKNTTAQETFPLSLNSLKQDFGYL